MTSKKTAVVTATQFEKAVDAGRRALSRGPLALSARYEAGRVHVALDNGCLFAFPVEHVDGLAGAKVSHLKEVKVEASGLGLHWLHLDVDLYVPTVVKGILGSRHWMAHIGAAGGRVKSNVKAASSRSNGAKGGRPRESSRLEDQRLTAIADARSQQVKKVGVDAI